MNKRKLVRNVSLVALSAVMLCGSAAALAGCKPDTTYELSVNIFCNDTDAATNRKICETWAENYTEELHEAGKLDEDKKVTVKFSYNADTTRYFDALDRAFSSTTGAADIMYLSPKYVKAWVQQNRVMDISEFITTDEQIANVNGIWSSSLGLYGYKKGETDYQMGQSLKYLKAGEAFTEGGTAVTAPGFYNAKGEKVELYGLPKDYSNFTLGYNAKFFTDDIREQLTTMKATQARTVKGARGNTSKLTFKGGDAEKDVITYEVNLTNYDNPFTPQVENITAKIGDPAPIIFPGVPIRYKPYNFYRFANYNDAIQGGDPVALSVEAYSEDGAGYVVTIPGFPGDTFDLTEYLDEDERDANAIYDNTIGHITYTYQEFGAFTWAICYYYNTFNWNCKNADGVATGAWSKEATLSGMGGIQLESGTMSNVYGNGQYEGSPNPTLYLLPWLYSNHADFINQSSTRAISGTEGKATAASTLTTIQKMKDEYAAQTTAAKAEKREKMHLDGSVAQEDYWYGSNTQNFIDAYAAFLEYASTWNGLDGNCGDEDSTKSDNGWTYFRGGAEIFYGAGTWDSATRNESDYADGYAGRCDFHLMPQAVNETNALYSTVKDGFYEGQAYYDTNNDGVAEKHAINSNEDLTKRPAAAFTEEQLYKNQINRQDQWGARMDSVGFAANASLLKTKGTDAEWKIAGAASLIMALSVDEDAQVTLTYSGAQIPNFTKQCEDFLNYQPTKVVGGEVVKNEKYVAANDTFSKMITPEGRVDVTNLTEAKNLWNAYYKIVCALDEGARDIGNFKGNTNKTVNEFLTSLDLFGKGAGKVSWKDKDGNDKEETIVHDPQYDSVKLGDFTGEISKRAYAMKILYMTPFNYSDRDINIRMQYGLNSARDSATYTYNTNWIVLISMRDGSNMAYNFAKPVMQGDGKTPGGTSDLKNLVQTIASEPVTTYQTPAAFCLNVAQSVQDALDEAIALEQRAMNKGK